MEHNFFEYLQTEAVVLTPNRRLSAALHKQYQQYQFTQNLVTWKTPLILPLISWMNQLWLQHNLQTCLSANLLLNASQEQYIWEQILLSHKDNEQLLQLSEASDLAKSAWGLLNQWQVNFQHPLFDTYQDTQALQQWVMEFQNKCDKNHWIDNASLANQIINHIAFQKIKSPEKIILFGFTEYSPQLSHLLNICEANGSELIKFEYVADKKECKRISLPDQENEIQTMARWAKKIINANPSVAIGCVIPSLDKIRDRVLQIFSEVFADVGTYTVAAQTTLFNISAGKSLSRYSVINAGLKLLDLHKENISSEMLSYLLTTPFIGDAESERIKRAHFDYQQRFNNINTINLLTHTQENSENQRLILNHDCPLLAKRIREFLIQIKEFDDNATYNEWANRFNTLLTTLGWPGERSLNSEEYQVVESWLKLLTEYKTLDIVSQPVKFSQALKTLQKMTNNSQFQPQTPEARIQVLGILEAAGMPFDYLWVAGMDDLSWPPSPKPNPFIPKRLQKELQMPHADAERELTFCNILTRQFKQSANVVIFSNAEKNDELELQTSPLIRDISFLTINQLELPEYISPSYQIFKTKKIESIVDEIAPAVNTNDKIEGGINVIQHQALCPFKSFAHWRLHAREMESPQPGLKARERGTIIHKALEILWNKLHDHATLISMNETELQTLISNCIDDAFTITPHSHSEFKNYISLEKNRIQQLLWDWLKIEKTRSPFKVVINEKASQFTIGPLTLSIRIDRIDELENGKKLVLDYKASKNNHVNSWFSERPEQPQLPLYALLDTENTCGISFAQIYPGEFGFKGVSHFLLDIDGIKLISEIKKTTALSWSEQLQQWQMTFTQLSKDFYQGVAKVDPKELHETCTWCGLKSLCRVNEV